MKPLITSPVYLLLLFAMASLLSGCDCFLLQQSAKFATSTPRILNPMHLPKKFTTSTLFTSRCDEYAELVKKPRWGGPILGPIVRRLNLYLVGFVFTVILRVLNRFKTHRINDLMKYVWKRPKGTALLTVSNHQSGF